MRGHHGPVPDVDTGHDGGVVADPYIVSDDRGTTTPSVLVARVVVETKLVKRKRRGVVGTMVAIHVKGNTSCQRGVVPDTHHALRVVHVVPEQDLGIDDIGSYAFFDRHFLFFFLNEIKKKEKKWEVLRAKMSPVP
jgi:hypothetical protein